nr:ActR/PrrA/RegA family redox response regulator transcription factor [Pararhizobium sp. IMCC21322]
MDFTKAEIPVSKQSLGNLFLVDDDTIFTGRIARALEGQGFAVKPFETMAQAMANIDKNAPDFAVIDIRLPDGNGLDLLERLLSSNAQARVIVLTGYGNIATAVAAIKMGAFEYLEKPATAEQLFNTLTRTEDQKPQPPENPMSADRVRWEHIQRIFETCDRNVSETARRLSMHRRTLQRILAKRAPR